MKTKHENLNEEIKRMKSLFTEERLYGNLVEQAKIDYTQEIVNDITDQADEGGNLNVNTIDKESLLKKIGGTIKNIAQQVGTGVENFGEKVDTFMDKQSVKRAANIEKKKVNKMGYVSGKDKRDMNIERATTIDNKKEIEDKETKSKKTELEACKKGVSNYVNLFLSMSKKKRKTVAQVQTARGEENYKEDIRRITNCLTHIDFKSNMEKWANDKYISFGFGDGMPKEGILHLLDMILNAGNKNYLTTNIWAKSTEDDGEGSGAGVKPKGQIINVKEEGGAQRILGKIQPQTDGSFIIQGTPGISFIYKKKLNDMYKLEIIKNLNNSGIKGDDIELVGKPKMKKNAYTFQFKLIGNDNINITNPKEV